MMIDIKPRYLGDGVYASFDGYHIILTTEIEANPPLVYLDPDVVAALIKYNTDILDEVTSNIKE
jgi:hypothetical protein